jgi:acetyltransferase-like isoleucine patch superfamily enzyme
MDIDDYGQGNSVECTDPATQQADIRIVLRGNNNRVVLGDGLVSTGAYIELGAECAVTIGVHCVLQRTFIYAQQASTIELGSHSSYNANVRLLLHEPSRLAIGAGSLIANDVDMMTSDMHSIVSIDTGARINHARNIVVGSNVWIGQRSMVLKGAEIGNGSIIAAGAIVAGVLPANVIAGGTPARVIRTGVTWDRRLL